MFIQLDPAWPQLRFSRALPELLTAVTELLTWHQPRDAPALHTARTVQQVTRSEFHILEALGFDLAIPTPVAWMEIFRRRLSLWEQEYCCPTAGPFRSPPAVFADCAHHTCDAYVQCFPFSAGSMASQVGASAWFVSTVLWICLGTCGAMNVSAAHCSFFRA